MAKFNFEEWTLERLFTKDTIQKLTKEDCTTFEAITSLSEADIVDLKLTIGQKNALTQGVRNLRRSVGQTVDDKDKHVDTKTLSQDDDLNNLLKSLGDSHLKDIFSAATKQDEQGERSSSSLTKALLIPDYLSKHIYSDQKEKILSVKGDTELFLRTQKTKKKPEEVSLPEWIAANARILRKLINDEKIDKRGILDYLDYTIQVGDYAQLYTTSSLMMLDDAHRRRVADEGEDWTRVSEHQFRFLLRSKTNSGSVNGANARQRKDLCIDFLRGNCRFGSRCKYSHQKQENQTQAPRFRNTQNQQETGENTIPPRFRNFSSNSHDE